MYLHINEKENSRATVWAVKQELFAFEQEWNVPDSHRFSMPDGTRSWCCRSVFEQHTAFKVCTSLSNQQVSTLPGCLSNFPCCAFASPFCKCSCYVNCVRHPPGAFVLFCCFFLTYTKQHKNSQPWAAIFKQNKHYWQPTQLSPDTRVNFLKFLLLSHSSNGKKTLVLLSLSSTNNKLNVKHLSLFIESERLYEAFPKL